VGFALTDAATLSELSTPVTALIFVGVDLEHKRRARVPDLRHDAGR